ncbi:MAG: hypothetical protein F6J95_028895 [Leptolyngbya sp. SIO1E4]|nr:hypothetical protein [Leptolyngbya sp. SIO1E4]
MTQGLQHYAKKFANLRVDRARGVAPHKPILLLAMIDLFEQGNLYRNEIYLSPELTANFLKFWHRFVSSDHYSNIALPFFHLTGELEFMPSLESLRWHRTRWKIKHQ